MDIEVSLRQFAAAEDKTLCIEGYGWSQRGYYEAWVGRKKYRAHRLAYCRHHGIDPDTVKGQVVLHSCDNPGCVNPLHLSLGTHRDNQKDKFRKGRQAKGEGHGCAKLSPDDVLLIKRLYVYGCRENGTVGLAKRFGVHCGTIWRIVRDIRWTHLSDEAQHD